MTLAALLLDMDGTIVDSDPVHMAVFIDFMAELGIQISEADYMSGMHGRRNEEIFAELMPDADGAALDAAKEARFRERLDEVPVMPGFHSLLDRAAVAGWKVALVTNACRANAEAVIATLGIGDRIDVLSLGEDAPRGKPDPACYLKALEILGVAAEDALAVEDSTTGIQAATGAGLRTIGMLSSLSTEALRAAGAVATVQDFNDPGLESWLRSSRTQPEGTGA